MTIDVHRAPDLPDGRHPCDLVASAMEQFYRDTPSIRYDVTLSLELCRPRAITLSYIRTLHKRRRRASLVLNELARLADENDVTLDLDARAIREDGPRVPGLSQEQLVSFYMRRGFGIVRQSREVATMRRLAPSIRRKP